MELIRLINYQPDIRQGYVEDHRDFMCRCLDMGTWLNMPGNKYLDAKVRSLSWIPNS